MVQGRRKQLGVRRRMNIVFITLRLILDVDLNEIRIVRLLLLDGGEGPRLLLLGDERVHKVVDLDEGDVGAVRDPLFGAKIR